MPFVSVTRLRLRSRRFLPAFFLYAYRSSRQLRAAPGYLAGQLAPGPARTFWTITVWTSEAAMRDYRNSGAHRGAMPRLIQWCDEAAVAHWEQADALLPSRADAARRLGADGRLSKVRAPSEAHAAGKTWTDGIVPSDGTPIPPVAGRARDTG